MGAKFLAVLEGRKMASVFEMKARITLSLKLRKREQSAPSPNRQALGMRWQYFRDWGKYRDSLWLLPDEGGEERRRKRSKKRS